MSDVVFISDFYRNQILGGAESNDDNLISYLRTICSVECFKSTEVRISDLVAAKNIIVSNFVLLPEEVKDYMIANKKYIIYEHDHKYVKTRDPSKYVNFLAPKGDLINVAFYTNADCVVVLSQICKDVLLKNIPETNVHSIGCSLWSIEKLNYIASLIENPKKGFCIMKSDNPTKNYINTIKFCEEKGIEPSHISNTSHAEFLSVMSRHRTLIFLPTVLETFSRICVEAKMIGLSTLTNKTNIGFYSEPYSSMRGLDLIFKIKEKQDEAYSFFASLL
jgi:hypothetical protein